MAEKGAYTLDAVVQQVESWKAQGLKVVFTNGVFDVLHVGHVEVLEVAAAHCQKLVVGVNSDASVRRLGKGPDRPIYEEGNRARVLAALRSVDAVVVFGDDTPLALVNRLQPDVVKGLVLIPLLEEARHLIHREGDARLSSKLDHALTSSVGVR